MKNINKEIKSRFLNSSQLRLKSIKDGRLRVGPEFVRIGISRSCNFNCTTCWNYSPLLKKQMSDVWKKVKIDKNLVFNLIDDLAQMQCLRILFSGAGEPFTHPQVMDFIKKAREKKMLVYIQTNLSLVDNAHQLANYLGVGPNLVCVHLSTATSKTYVKMHPNQTEKCFYKILDRIRILKNEGIPIRLVYIVNKLNYKEIPEALRLNKKLKTRLHLEIMDYDFGSGLEKAVLNEFEKKKIIQNLSQLRKQKEYRLNSNIDDFIKQLIHSALGVEKLNSCCIGYFVSVINELGQVKYCFNRDKDILIGDLNKKSFNDIWFSQEYNNLRIKLLKGEFLNVCQNCIKERGYNFKVRMYVNPRIRDFKLEEKVLSY